LFIETLKKTAPAALMAGLHYGFSRCGLAFCQAFFIFFSKTHNFGQLLFCYIEYKKILNNNKKERKDVNLKRKQISG
jgi:hypothetical protein